MEMSRTGGATGPRVGVVICGGGGGGEGEEEELEEIEISWSK